MPSGRMSMEIIGDTAGVEHMLQHLQDKLSPPAMGGFLDMKVSPYLQLRAKNRFSNEGDDVVGKWAPLTPFTQQLRAAQGYGPAHPINKRTGQLEHYITEGPNRLIIDPGGATLTLPGAGTARAKDKLRVAQQGEKVKGRVTPPRPVLGMNERDLFAVLTMLAHDIEGSFL